MDVSIENLSKSYGSHLAVDNISFHVQPGEVLGFLGPNGAGKSTTMKMITCYLKPSSGNIKVGDTSILEDPEDAKKKIGYLPENNPLYLDMGVVDYLRFFAQLHGVPKTKVEGRIREMIGVCGINREKHRRIGELSKGYRQRVGLAQAMIHDPEILILDEPTTGLDPNQIVEIRKLIKDLGRAKTVVLSTHILPEVESTCDRILIINRGKIVADGTADSLRKQAQGREILKIKIEDGTKDEIFATLRQMRNVLQVEPDLRGEGRFEIQLNPNLDNRRNLFRLCVEKNWILTELTPIETRLEDIFRNLTLN